jgi:hypothetical protein
MRFTFRKLRTLRSGLDHLQRLAQIVRPVLDVPRVVDEADLARLRVSRVFNKSRTSSFFGRPEGDGCGDGRHRGHKEKYADNQSFCHEAVTDRRSSANRLC